MFAEAHDLDPDGLILEQLPLVRLQPRPRHPPQEGRPGYYGGTPAAGPVNPRIAYWHHPGFAWAARARRSTPSAASSTSRWSARPTTSWPSRSSARGSTSSIPASRAGYRKAVIDWQARALKLRGNLGYVPGTVLHHWHGRKASRKYWDRCKILTDTQFDPVDRPQARLAGALPARRPRTSPARSSSATRSGPTSGRGTRTGNEL